ncbi:MAG: hypothetical protein BGO14_02155 [Chlamydiales bacterium 38-26]|nr:DUF3638 domain-containing protein [Chlamydiales bacterium]OJV08244.1 MAG: hypothetical protein BGO14_02155 [Chlamydiales bacterium 38-26]
MQPLFNNNFYSRSLVDSFSKVKNLNDTEQTPAVKAFHERQLLLKNLQSQLKLYKETLAQNSFIQNKEFMDSIPTLDINYRKALISTNLGSYSFGTEDEGWLIKSLGELHFNILSLQQPVFSQQFIPELRNSIHQIATQSYESSEDKDVQELVTTIQQLKIQESFVMVGGWFATPNSHAMLYRFIRKDTGHYDIYIYDTYGGLQNNGGYAHNERVRVYPYLLFKNVEWEELFFCKIEEPQESNPALFKKLCLLREESEDGIDNDLNDVYLCFYHIQHRLEESQKLPKTFISTQRGGNCVVKTFHCLYLHILEESMKDTREQFKLAKNLILDLRFYTILYAYKNFKNISSPDANPKDLYVLKTSCQNYLQFLDIQFQRSQLNIPEKSYLIASATIHDILNDLENMKSRDQISRNFEPPMKMTAIHEKTKSTTLAWMNSLLMLKTSSNPQVFIPPPRIFDLTWEGFPSSIKQFIKECAHIEDANLLSIEIEQFLRTCLPLLNDSQKLENKKIAESSSLSDLFKLQRIYRKALFDIHKVATPVVQNTMMIFVALGYIIACRQDEPYEILRHFGIDVRYYYDLARRDPFFMTLDPQNLEERQTLETFFNKLPLDRLFDFYEYKRVSFKNFIEEFAEGILFKSYLTHAKINQEFESLKVPSYLQKFFTGQVLTLSLLGAFACYANIRLLKSVPTLTHIYRLQMMCAYAYEACNVARRVSRGVNRINEAQVRIVSSPHYVLSQGMNTPLTLENSFLQASQFYLNLSDQAGALARQVLHTGLHLSENDWIVQQEIDENFRLHLALAEPHIQTTLLLKSLEYQIERCQEASFRSLFKQMLFKVTPQDQILVSPLMESLKDPLYIQKFEAILERGFNVFTELSHQPKVEEMLFLIQLYAFALQIVQKHQIIELSLESLRWIKRIEAFLLSAAQTDDQKIKSNVKLCQVSILIGMPLTQQTFEQRVLFFRTWLELPSSSSLFTTFEMHHLQSLYSSSFMQKAWNEVLNTEDAIQAFGNQIVSEIIHSSFQAQWTLKANRLSGLDADGEHWSIDLFHPQINSSQGIFIKKFDILNLPSFIPSKHHEVSYFGNMAYFYDELWGELRKTQTELQKNIEGEWCSVLLSRLKMHLYQGHILFYINICFLSASKKMIYLYDPQTAVMLYVLHEGQLRTVDQTYTLHLIKSQPHGVFCRLDTSSGIGYWQNNLADSPERAKIIYHRFFDDKGNCLSFFLRKDSERWHCQQMPQYALDSGDGWEWDVQVSHYLCLIHESDSSQRKILIPQAPLGSKGFSKEVIFNFSEDLDSDYAYFIFNVSPQGELQGQTTEDRIYLIHLHLAQKNYHKAYELLKILPDRGFSELSISLVLDILKSSPPCCDFSPNASVLRLQLWAAIYPHSYRDMQKTELLQVIFELYLTYLRGLNNIDKQFLLDFKKERSILETLSISENLKNFVKVRNLSLEQHKEFRRIFEVGKSLETYPDAAHAQVNMDSMDLYKLFFTEKNVEARNLYEKLKNAHPTDNLRVRGLIYAYIDAKIKKNTLWFWHRIVQAGNLLPDLPPQTASREQIDAFINALKKFSTPSGMEDTDLLKFARALTVKDFVGPDLRDQSLKTTPRLLQWPPVPLQMTSDADDRFKELKNKYLVPHQPDPLNLDSVKVFSKTEEPPQDIVKRREQHYLKDSEIATFRSQNFWEFKGEVYPQLLQDLKKEEQDCKKQMEYLKKSIVQLVDFASSSLQFAQLHNFRYAVQQRMTLEQVIRAIFHPSSELFEKINPYLNPRQLQELRALCIDYMTEATHYRQIKQAADLLKKWLDSGQSNHTAYENLLDVFSQEREYDPADRVYPLIFEYFSELRVLAKQARLINILFESILDTSDDEKKQNKIFQLIMGGGKTTVILSFLLELAAREGHVLACILSHHSQMVSLKGFLDAQHRQRFLKKTTVFDYTVKELSDVNVLNTIYKDLQEAFADQRPVLMKTSFPGFISLKLQIAFLTNPMKNGDLIQALQKIDRFLSTHAMSFYDECDLALQMTSYINMTLWERKNILAQRAEVVKNIFEVLLRPEIESLISLRSNLQTELSEEDFKKKIAPVIAESIFENPEFKLKNFPQHRQAFFRYLSNAIPVADEELALNTSTDDTILPKTQQENVHFLRLLHQYYQSDDLYEKNAANQIAFSKFIIYKVLPRTLGKSFNRNYGRDLSEDNGRVIPYQAVGCPSHTRFGNIYSTLVYHFQSAVKGISRGEVTFLAKKMTEAADYYSKRDNVSFNKTLEAQQFFTLTSVELDRILEPGMLEKAFHYINDSKDLLRRLKVEAEVAPFFAQYYPKRVKYTAINNVETFRRSLAFSGTPYNHETYHPRFDRPLLDEGSEGSILNALEKYEKLEQLHILEIPGIELTHFLEVVRQHPKKAQLRAFVDSEGLLRNYKNEEIAQNFLKLFEELRPHGGPDIDGVIYVHKFSHEEAKQAEGLSESYVLLKKDEPKILLNHIGEDELIRHRIRSTNVFILMDEPRATGTNIQLDDEALFLVTVDHRTTMRKALQAVFRARKIFKGQRVDFIITSKSRSMLANQGAKLVDFRESWIKNEALNMQEDQQLARIEMIKNVIWKVIRQDLQSKNLETLKTLLPIYENFLIDTFEDKPFEQNGFIEYQTSAYPVLEKFANQYMQSFIKKAPQHATQVKNEMSKLLEVFKNQISSTETLSSTILRTEDLDMTVEVEVEVENEILEEQLDLELDLKQELEDYNLFKVDLAYKEKEWEIAQSENLWEQIKERLFNLPQTLQKTYVNDKGEAVTTKQYSQCFPEHFWITDNFYYTYTKELPLLHRYSKLASFVLVILDEKKYQLVILSEKDASYFARLLKLKPSSSVFLLDESGLPEVNSASYEKAPSDLKNKCLQDLWLINIYNGNLDFVEKYYESYKHLIESHEALVARFIQLRVGNNPQHLRKLLSSSILDLNKVLVKYSREMILFSSRRNEIERSYHRLRMLDQKEIAQLDPQLVKNIASHQVRWLVTKEQIAHLSKTQLYHLSLEQISLLSEDRLKDLMNPALIQALPVFSVDKLQLSQLNFLNQSQAAFLKKDMIKKLTKKHSDLIQKLSREQIQHLNDELLDHLSTEQINWIEEKRLSFISNINLLKISQNKFENSSDEVKERLISILNGQSKDCIHVLQDYHLALLQENAPLIKSLSSLQHLIKLKPIHFKSLDMRQLQILSESDLSFSDEQIEALTPEQIFQLNGKQAKLISQLKVSQFRYLNDESLQWIAPHQVKEIKSPEVLSRFKHPKLVLKITQEQFLSLEDSTKKQIRALVNQSMHPNDLQSFHLSMINPDSIIIKFILKKEMLEQLPPSCFTHLSPQQLINVSLGNLKPEQVQQIPARYLQHVCTNGQLCAYFSESQIRALTPVQTVVIQKLVTEQLHHLNTDSLRKISLAQLELIEEPGLLNRLTEPEHLLHLKQNQFLLLNLEVQKKVIDKINTLIQLKLLQDYHLEYIQPGAPIIHYLDQPGLFQKLQPQCFGRLVSYQIPIVNQCDLTPEQVQNILPHFIPSLNSKFYKDLSMDQIKKIQPNQKEIIQKLLAHQLSFLTNEALQAISVSQLLTLSSKDLNRIRAGQLLLSIPFERYKELDPKTTGDLLVKTISTPAARSHLKPYHYYLLILSPAEIPHQSIDMLLKVHFSCFEHLTSEQVLMLKEHKLNSMQVSRLSLENLTLLSNPQHIQLISPIQLQNFTHKHAQQIPYLNQQQLAHLPGNLINHLVENQIPWIPENRLIFLTEPRLIKFLSATQIDVLTKEHAFMVPHLDLTQLKDLKVEMLEYLSVEQIKGLTEAAQDLSNQAMCETFQRFQQLLQVKKDHSS